MQLLEPKPGISISFPRYLPPSRLFSSFLPLSHPSFLYFIPCLSPFRLFSHSSSCLFFNHHLPVLRPFLLQLILCLHFHPHSFLESYNSSSLFLFSGDETRVFGLQTEAMGPGRSDVFLRYNFGSERTQVTREITVCYRFRLAQYREAGCMFLSYAYSDTMDNALLFCKLRHVAVPVSTCVFCVCLCPWAACAVDLDLLAGLLLQKTTPSGRGRGDTHRVRSLGNSMDLAIKYTRGQKSCVSQRHLSFGQTEHQSKSGEDWCRVCLFRTHARLLSASVRTYGAGVCMQTPGGIIGFGVRVG